ncbi:MAG: DUF547 domain-containing protein [Planctomycetes bacterium]|nr:DUF547 domain-containing protein [Planctomycetota bacterium]
MFRLRYVLPLVAVLAIGTFIYVKSCTAERQTIGTIVPADQRVAIDEGIDHGVWDGLLKKYVDQRGFVDYTAWKASAADTDALKRYLATLSAADLTKDASREGRLAFWINAYNALTIHGILEKYPTNSIKDHVSRFGGYNIWKDLLLTVGDKKYSLEGIEHEVLRKMGEPRIHFAIVCASIGCPRLLAEAYAPLKIEQQLDVNTRAFFADRAKFDYDAGSGTLHVSPILKWFAEDFGRDQAERLRTIAPYLPDQVSRELAAGGSARVKYLDYDWNLNDRK